MTTPPMDAKLVRERLQRFLRQARDRGKPWSQSQIAKAIGKSSALISTFLHEDYRGDIPALCRELTSFLEQQDAKAQAGDWTLPYVEIRQARIATDCLTYAHVHQEMVALIGDSGRGKTVAIARFRQQHPQTILIEASRIHGPSAILQELCQEIGESDRGKCLGLLKRIVYELRGSQRLLIVDDAHKLGPAALDMLVTVYDRTNVGILLAGISSLEHRLIAITPELEQLARRVTFRRRLPDYVEADAEEQITHTLTHLDAGDVLAAFDPKAKSSPAWVGKVCKVAGKLAGGLDKVQLTHIKIALKMVA